MIVAFISVDTLVGPSELGWVSAAHQVSLLANRGIALSFFAVGLELELQYQNDG